jgi:hypothetical protein
MASSTTVRQLPRIGAVVVGGGVTSWWLKGKEDESSNGNADEDSKTHIWPRHHLVDHLHVTLTTPMPITRSSLPDWLLPSLLSALPPPLPSMEGEAEQAQKRSQQQHLQPPPLLFLSCADPFVIENLVQDVFEKRYVKRCCPCIKGRVWAHCDRREWGEQRSSLIQRISLSLLLPLVLQNRPDILSESNVLIGETQVSFSFPAPF